MTVFVSLNVFICAIWVIQGATRTRMFIRDADKRCTNISQSLEAASEISCCRACTETDGCTMVNYSPSLHTCELSQIATGNTAAVVSKTGWDVYAKLVCLQGWTLFENSCLYLDLQARSQEDAQNSCSSRMPSAHLVDLTTEARDVFVKDWLMATDTDNVVWLGGMYDMERRQFLWSDGTPFTTGHTSWNFEQPSGSDEHCVGVLSQSDFNWISLTCSNICQSICEYTLI